MLYVRRMTTSTRVYMFVLAVVHFITSICGIVDTIAPTEQVPLLVFSFTLDMALVFFTLLLAFVAIERLLAVRRAHTFNLKAMRTKEALDVVTVIAVAFTTAFDFARLMNYFCGGCANSHNNHRPLDVCNDCLLHSGRSSTVEESKIRSHIHRGSAHNSGIIGCFK